MQATLWVTAIGSMRSAPAAKVGGSAHWCDDERDRRFDRPDRPAHSPLDAAATVRRFAADGLLDDRATEVVLAVAGHRTSDHSRGSRAEHPGGLTKREVEVLRLAAQGLTTAAISERLYISPKTADHHIQSVYTKIGVSTRVAAALWAMQHDLVN